MTARSFYATGQLAIFPQYLRHRCARVSRACPDCHMLLASHHSIGSPMRFDYHRWPPSYCKTTTTPTL